MFWSILFKVSLTVICSLLIMYLFAVGFNCFKELTNEKIHTENKTQCVFIIIGALIAISVVVTTIICIWLN